MEWYIEILTLFEIAQNLHATFFVAKGGH